MAGLVVVSARLRLPRALTAANALEPARFVGLDNLVEVANDSIFREASFHSGV